MEIPVAIIGNGSLGCSIAIQLIKKSDENFTIFGRKERVGSASKAAGMMLNLFAELHEDELSSPFSRTKFEMGLLAKSMWSDWVNYLNSVSQVPDININYGTYVISNSAGIPEIEDKTFSYIIKVMDEYDCPYELVDTSEENIRGYQPRHYARALKSFLIKDEGFIEPNSVFLAFDDILQNSAQATVVDNNVVHISVLEDGTFRLVTDEGNTYLAKKVVIAAGSFSQHLIDQLDISNNIPKLFYGTGVGLHVRLSRENHKKFILPDKVIRTTARGFACGINLVPWDKERCYIGATSMVLEFGDNEPQIDSVYTLLTSAMEELNQELTGASFKTVLGHRPTTADLFPILGSVSIDGLFIASGTKREGFFLSPLISDSISEEILGRPALTPPEFKPERELIFDLKREEAIHKIALNYVSYYVQHGLKSPFISGNFLKEQYESFKEKTKTEFDKLGVEEARGIPPELYLLYKKGALIYKRTPKL
eukprot:TRINITY_DN6026_c0_g2_i1.p1 TRINITY_DN6026_c0_g2~~TRINITY_DN6026_c0_g2_i1.p1  ORF type:complete len:481 (+),score=83.62 TRINITY_DN6026_c0_g2_i1:84-1526(+)